MGNSPLYKFFRTLFWRRDEQDNKTPNPRLSCGDSSPDYNMNPKIKRPTADQKNIKLPLSFMCDTAWDKYKWRLKDEEDYDPSWEVILNDSRCVEFVNASRFQVTFPEVIENLFLGCRQAMSDNIYRNFVDFVVEETKNAIETEIYIRKNEEFYKEIPLHLFKEDQGKEIRMIFLMVIQTSQSASEEGSVENETTWESFIKLQIICDEKQNPNMEHLQKTFENYQRRGKFLHLKVGLHSTFDLT